MTELEYLILYWKTLLQTTGYMMEPSPVVQIKNTIKHLEELQKIKEGAL